MTSFRRRQLALVALAVSLGTAAAFADRTESPRSEDLLARLPLAFEPNLGQADPSLRYLARGPGYTIGVAADALTLRFTGADGAQQAALRPVGGRLEGLEAELPVASFSAYVTLPEGASTVASHYRRVRARQVWQGIDAVFYGNAGALEYDFEVEPGADPSAIGLAIDRAVLEGDSGDLLIRSEGGRGSEALARFAAPVTYQLAASGGRELVESRYRVEDGIVRFEVGSYDRTRPLVIDPVLLYSTYLGGGGVFSNQQVDAIAAGPNGEAYVAGVTESSSFPIVNAGSCDDELNDNVGLNGCNGSPASVATDAFVAKIAADGASLLYSTYIGGAGWDRALAIAITPSGEAWIGGDTWDGISGSSRDAFLVRMNAAGNGASFAAVFGGQPPPGYFGLEYGDSATSLALDASGNVYVGGWTASDNFHPAGVPGLDQTYGGASDGFIRRYTAAGVLTNSTYVGSPFLDDIQAVALASDGSIFGAGKSFSQDQVFGDVYIIRLDGTLSGIVAGSTIISGTNGEERVNDIAVDASNRVWMVGETSASNFCDGVVGGIDHIFSGPTDGYAFRISANLAAVDVCTFLGGNGASCDRVQGIALSAGGITMVGGTQPGATNCTDDFDLTEAFALRLDANAGSLLWTNAFGGPSFPDQAQAVAIAPGDRVLVGGMAGSGGYPVTAGAAQTLYPSAALRAGFVMAIDPVARLSIEDASVTEGNSGTKNLGFTVRLNGYPLQNVSFNLATANGTATAGSDYVARSGACTNCFTAGGASSRTENVVINGDTASEPNETFSFALSSPVNAVLGDGTATGTILNDDVAGSIRFSASTYTVAENGGSASITLQRTGGSSGAVGVTCATVAGGTATAGQDYTSTSASVSWANGDTANKTCSIPIANDTGDEANETVNLALSSPTGGATLGSPSTATLTITDNDPLPAVSITDTSVTEGSSGTVSVSFTVTLDRTGYQTATVNWATANGTATAPADYGAGSGPLTFTAGQTSKTITRSVVGDTLDETNETFSIVLSAPNNMTISDSTGVCTITDDDTAGTVQFQTSTSSLGEGSGASSVVITRSGGAASAVTVQYAVAGGTATGGGVDYSASNGSVTFGAGETSKTFPITLVQDTIDEPNETIVVTLSSPGGGASLGSPTVHTRTITDDDVGGSVQFQSASSSIGEGTGASLVVTRTGGSASAVTVQYAVTGGSATGGGVDYTLVSGTLTFGAGESSKSISVGTAQDTIDEPNETVVVTLSSPGGGATLGSPSAHTLTITDDDVAGSVQFAAASSSVAEGAGTVNLVITRSGGAASAVSVQYAVSGGTATGGGVDYTLAGGSVTFGAGETTKNVAVAIVQDTQLEGIETVVVSLSSPGGGASLGSPTVHTLTILDDDSNEVFADGFESGDTSAWSLTVPLVP